MRMRLGLIIALASSVSLPVLASDAGAATSTLPTESSVASDPAPTVASDPASTPAPDTKKSAETTELEAVSAQTSIPVQKAPVSLLQEKLHEQAPIINNPLGILFYEPTYVLPYAYTTSPDSAIYNNNTPDQQRVLRSEFKTQLSFQMPVIQRVANKPVDLYVSYTQLSFWQVYAKSQYFRETNYEPQLFFVSNFRKNFLARLGVDHQSNGRGGSLERSWNRVFFSLNMAQGRWLFVVNPWLLIFRSESSDIHNPGISKYLGHERFIIAYKTDEQTEFSLTLRNVEHPTNYITEIASISKPISKRFNGYFQIFNGYGQSLIEYDHKTTGVGIGIALNDWL